MSSPAGREAALPAPAPGCPAPRGEGALADGRSGTSWCQRLPPTLCTRAATQARGVSLRDSAAVRGQCLQYPLLSMSWAFA